LARVALLLFWVNLPRPALPKDGESYQLCGRVQGNFKKRLIKMFVCNISNFIYYITNEGFYISILLKIDILRYKIKRKGKMK